MGAREMQQGGKARPPTDVQVFRVQGKENAQVGNNNISCTHTHTQGEGLQGLGGLKVIHAMQ